MRNQLIYEKCNIRQFPTGKDINEQVVVNVDNAMHWGQKYEPVTVMIYENMHSVQVGDFGCIPHSEHSFIGASPDGIVISPESDKYGRMVEIKNVVSRIITGIPKYEYWVQMQLQMETCNLNECDFVETKFIEYPGYSEYLADTETGKFKTGMIMYFQLPNGNVRYFYKPLDITCHELIEEWEKQQTDQIQLEGAVWIKNIYWKMEVYNCVVVLRNKTWFNDNIHILKQLWDEVLHDRAHGYDHRKPKSKGGNGEMLSSNKIQSTIPKCLINLIKLNETNETNEMNETNETNDVDSMNKLDTTNDCEQSANISE